MLGLTPHTKVLFWGPHNFLIKYSNRDHTSWNARNCHLGSSMVHTGVLIKQYEVPLLGMLHDILMFNQVQYCDVQSAQALYNSLTWYQSRPLPNHMRFKFCICVRCHIYQQGTLSLLYNWSRAFLELHMLYLLRPVVPKSALILQTFCININSGTILRHAHYLGLKYLSQHSCDSF